MPSLLRVIILIFVLSFAVSSPLPYTIEGLEYGVSENDIKDIEQKRASGVDERSIRLNHPREVHNSSQFTSKIVQLLNRLGWEDPVKVAQATTAIKNKLNGAPENTADQVRKRDVEMFTMDGNTRSDANSDMDMAEEHTQMEAEATADFGKREDQMDAGDMMMMENENQRSSDSSMDTIKVRRMVSDMVGTKKQMEPSRQQGQQEDEQQQQTPREEQRMEQEEMDESQNNAQDEAEESLAMNQA